MFVGAPGPSQPPTAVGGLGGSGTRVLAAILKRAGYYIGEDLNRSLDNRWFTLLLRRPAWRRRMLARGSRGQQAIDRHVETFLDAASGQLRPTPAVLYRITRGVVDAARDLDFDRRWAFTRARSMLRARGPSDEAVGWGWKEPNTHIYLDTLARRVPELRYIHVIRHGLDMAVSSNQTQLRLWGEDFDLPAGPPSTRAFRAWRAMNTRALNIAQRLLPSRHVIVRFEDLCSDPEAQIRRVLDLVDSPKDPRRFTNLVEPPSSLGRRDEAVLRALTQQDVESLHLFGYSA